MLPIAVAALTACGSTVAGSDPATTTATGPATTVTPTTMPIPTTTFAPPLTTTVPPTSTTTVAVAVVTAPLSASQGCTLTLIEAPMIAMIVPGSNQPEIKRQALNPLERFENLLRSRYSCWFTAISLTPLDAATIKAIESGRPPVIPPQDVIVHAVEEITPAELEALRVESGLTVKVSAVRSKVALYKAEQNLARVEQALATRRLAFNSVGVELDGTVLVEVDNEADINRVRNAVGSDGVVVQLTENR